MESLHQNDRQQVSHQQTAKSRYSFECLIAYSSQLTQKQKNKTTGKKDTTNRVSR
jgi:hypothetical protein